MTDDEASLEEALAYLDEHVNFEAIGGGRFAPPTLDRMRRLCALSGEPQEAAPVIHLTGTNGKGSTASMVTALLVAHGLSVGTYTSPDLARVHERISRDGEPIGDDDLATEVMAVAELERITDVRPTRFEILTLAALRWFAEIAVDVAVLEVGMAGRWDATNVADALVAVVTNVGLDHTQVLGPTTAHIAREKAGIVKPGSTLVLGETDPDLVEIFLQAEPARAWLLERDMACTANRLAVGGRLLDLRTPGAIYDEVFLSLHGAHQGTNALLATTAVEAFFERPVEDEVLRATLAGVSVPGRFEVVARSPLVVLDGAHNPDGARAAAATLDDVAGDRGRILVVGMNDERDEVEMLEALQASKARLVIASAADWARAKPAAAIADAAVALGVAADVVDGVPDAVAAARRRASPSEVVLVAGSLYVVGEARSALPEVASGRHVRYGSDTRPTSRLATNRSSEA